MALISCPECKKEISDSVESCPHCGFRIQPKPEVKEESTGIITWLIRGLIAFIIIAIVGTCLVTPDAVPPPKRTTITDLEAKVAAEGEVEALLKSPSTAKFSGVGDTKITPIAGGYNISGYVDSQNGFGAMIRSSYSVDIIFDKSTGKIMQRNLKVE